MKGHSIPLFYVAVLWPINHLPPPPAHGIPDCVRSFCSCVHLLVQILLNSRKEKSQRAKCRAHRYMVRTTNLSMRSKDRLNLKICPCCMIYSVCFTVFSVFTWRHGGHLGVQNNSEKIILGIWFYYYSKRERHFAIVLYTSMGVSSREWKPRITRQEIQIYFVWIVWFLQLK